MTRSAGKGTMKKSGAISCLFLDIGGVLLTDGWDHHAQKRAANEFKLDLSEMENLHHLTFETYEEGKLTLEEYLGLVVFNKKRAFTRTVFRRFMFAQSKPYAEMIDLVGRLKAGHGLKIAVVSNEARELNVYRIQQFKLDALWGERYRSILDLERHLYCNGTRIVKVFLHLSRGEQRKRFFERIDDPDKNWKFSLSDIHERKYWQHYMEAYEACLSATSTHHAPWYVVPADDKENARLVVSRIVLDVLKELKMTYPRTTAKRRRELKSIRRHLAK